jgi:hypothetical protein
MWVHPAMVYCGALNDTSSVAFAQGKISWGTKPQALMHAASARHANASRSAGLGGNGVLTSISRWFGWGSQGYCVCKFTKNCGGFQS